MATPPLSTPKSMLFTTYNIRADRTDEEYEKFCREVDNPFYNSLPGVHYENWKVAEHNLGRVGFTYMDMIVVDSDDPFAMFLDNDAVKTFCEEWIHQWAEFGTGDEYVGRNYQIVTIERIAAPEPE